jgi:hypothetical protein
MTSGCSPCTLRRSDGQTGHKHWLKAENELLYSPPKSPEYSYHGSCQCDAISYEFQSISSVDSDATFYICECNACSKRAYLFYVVPLKHFKFASRSASDLGTYASLTGLQCPSWMTTDDREFPSLLLSSLWRCAMGRM